MKLSYIWKIPFYALIFFFSFLFPKDKKTWVFIGWHKSPRGQIFADNCKYLFLYISNNYKKITSVWLTEDEKLCQTLRATGYQSYNLNTLEGIFYALKAKYAFVDALLPKNYLPFFRGAKIIQLWHTRGLKKLKIEKPYFLSPTYEYLFSPSSFVSENLLSDFNTPSKNIFITGSPKTDVFFREIPGAEIGVNLKLKEKLNKLKKEKNQKFILYYYTFRRGNLDFEIEKIINSSELDSLMEEQKAHFFISLHPKFRNRPIRPVEGSRISIIEESDIYPLLKHFNVLITDYSSIFVDFLLLEKPIIFFPYDLKEYRQKEEFALEYERYTPGSKAFNSKLLLKEIKKALRGEDNFKEKRKEIRNLYHQYKDGKACERITKLILSGKII